MRRPRAIGKAIVNLDYTYESPCFSTFRMDEGPVLNELGNLIVFLYILGVRTSTQEMLLNKQPDPKWFGWDEI